MNSNTSAASPTISTELPFTPLNSMQGSPAIVASHLEPIIQQLTPSSIMTTGNSSSNLVLMPLELPLTHRIEGAVTPVKSLKSHVKPHELLEKLDQVVPRVLHVSQSDLAALCQVVKEFRETCTF